MNPQSIKNNNSLAMMSRRDILKLFTLVGASTLGGCAFPNQAPELSYDQQVEYNRRAIEKDTKMSVPMRELVRYATLAANGHNTQPWKFAIKENEIEIHPDYSRRVPVVDPHDRELWISLGCALENLLIAARAAGYTSEVTYPETGDFIRIQLATDTPQASPLFDAIPLRQTTRSEYDRQMIPNDDLTQIHALPLEADVTLRFVTNNIDLETVLDYVNQGNLSQYSDKAYLDELLYWLRFNKKEALASQDGLFSLTSGNPEVPRWLGQIFLKSTGAQQQADADAKKLRSSPSAVVVASTGDHKRAWVQ